MLDKPNGLSNLGLVNILGKLKTLTKLILFFIKHFRRAGHA